MPNAPSSWAAAPQETTGPRPDAFLAVCPSREVVQRIGEKWSLLAVVALQGGPLRFSALQRKLEGVSQKMLTQTLRRLERDGLVHRELFDVMPLRVEYRLTKLGRSFLPLAKRIKGWAELNLATIETHQRAFDADGR